MENLEEWSIVMKEKISHFDDVVDRLKGAIINVRKTEEAKLNHEENIFRKKCLKEERKKS